MPAFGPDVPVLTPGRTTYQRRHAWLLWPALQYRVVTPLVYEPAVNTFQRAMLGLVRAGQRDLGTMAGLLGLEPEFAELVRDDLRTLRYLDEFGVVTPAGEAALDDGFLDPQRIVVTHVYQDAWTGALWPTAVPAPMLVGARWAEQDWAEVDIGTVGDTANVRALAIPAKGELPDAPSADDVVEAVSRGSQTGGLRPGYAGDWADRLRCGHGRGSRSERGHRMAQTATGTGSRPGVADSRRPAGVPAGGHRQDWGRHP